MEEWLEDIRISDLQKELEIEKNLNNIRNGNTGIMTIENQQQIWKESKSLKYNRHLSYPHLFHNISKRTTTDKPSEFMINFIDATHNIFQIQQKQIEELQDIITKQQSGKRS